MGQGETRIRARLSLRADLKTKEVSSKNNLQSSSTSVREAPPSGRERLVGRGFLMQARLGRPALSIRTSKREREYQSKGLNKRTARKRVVQATPVEKRRDGGDDRHSKRGGGGFSTFISQLRVRD